MTTLIMGNSLRPSKSSKDLEPFFGAGVVALEDSTRGIAVLPAAAVVRAAWAGMGGGGGGGIAGSGGLAVVGEAGTGAAGEGEWPAASFITTFGGVTAGTSAGLMVAGAAATRAPQKMQK